MTREVSLPCSSLLYPAPVSEFSRAQSTRDTFVRLQRQLWGRSGQPRRVAAAPRHPAYHDPSLVQDDDD
jgi:hypothetical protein